MFGLDVNASESNNNWGLSVLIAFASGVWLLVIEFYRLDRGDSALNAKSAS
jgi:hypothetical protein